MADVQEDCSKSKSLDSVTNVDETRKEGHPSDDRKKKQRRRRRKPSRKTAGKPNHLAIRFPSHPRKDEAKAIIPKKKKKWRSARPRGPVLRPVGAQVPRAPNNSTQFIMDDHENSSLFVHFNRDEMLKQNKSEGECDGSSPFQSSDWLPYNLADFEFAYQIAREDQMMNASIADLRKAILGIESKITVASEHLEASPSRILACLQEQLLKLQEENSALKQKKTLMEHYKSSSSSSSSTSSSSSSTSSSSSSSSSDSDSDSSSCSDEDCNTCVQERRALAQEEKENTRPSPPQNDSPPIFP